MKKLLALGALAALCFSATAFAADPILRTWTLDVSKSQFGPTRLSAGTRVYTESKGTYTLDQKLTTADGKEISSKATYRNGKETKQGASDVADSTMAKKIDANTWDFELKKDGKVVGHVHRTVSADGKTLTVRNSGVKLSGTSGEETLVFDKQ